MPKQTDNSSTLLIRDLDRNELQAVQEHYKLPSLASTVRFIIADWLNTQHGSPLPTVHPANSDKK